MGEPRRTFDLRVTAGSPVERSTGTHTGSDRTRYQDVVSSAAAVHAVGRIGNIRFSDPTLVVQTYFLLHRATFVLG